MGLRLFDRFTTLIKADTHGLLESLEERSLLLKQYVREAEIELDRKRARLEAVSEEEQRLGDELTRLDADIHALDADVALAMKEGREDVARFAIRRLIPRRNQRKALQAQVKERADERVGIQSRLQAQEEQFEHLKTRVRAELGKRAEPEWPAAWLGEDTVAEEEVELELLRRRQEGARRSD